MSPRSKRVRWLAFAVLLIGQLMIVLDVSVVNIALPTIQSNLHFSQSALAWVVNAYLITFGGFLLFAGRLGDLLGHKKIFIKGMTIFTIASIFCGLSQTATMLIVARFIQGFGAALVSAVVLGILFKLFTDKNDQIQSLGYYGLVGAAGAAIGLVIGGILTELINWHWIFFINIPFGILAVIGGAYLIPNDKGIGFKQGIDIGGAVLLVTSLTLFNYVIVEAADKGFFNIHIVAYFIIALFLMGLFIFVESRIKHPLIFLGIFKLRNLIQANATQFFVIWSLFSSYFLTALYLQGIYHLSPILAGVAFIPQTGVYGVMGVFVAPRLMKKLGSRTTVLLGLPIYFVSLALFAILPLFPNYLINILPAMILFGIGGTMASLPLSHLAMSEAKKSDAGLASGLINTSRQVGGAVGVALIGSISAAYTAHVLMGGGMEPGALLSGYHLGFALNAVVVIIAFLFALTFKTATHDQDLSSDERVDMSLEVSEL